MNNKFEWHGFAKFWLWFVFIINILSAVGSLVSAATGGLIYVIGFILEIVLLVGIYTILFKKAKKGFYMVAAASVISFIVNASSGAVVSGILGLVLGLLILYLAIRSHWDEME